MFFAFCLQSAANVQSVAPMLVHHARKNCASVASSNLPPPSSGYLAAMWKSIKGDATSAPELIIRSRVCLCIGDRTLTSVPATNSFELHIAPDTVSIKDLSVALRLFFVNVQPLLHESRLRLTLADTNVVLPFEHKDGAQFDSRSESMFALHDLSERSIHAYARHDMEVRTASQHTSHNAKRQRTMGSVGVSVDLSVVPRHTLPVDASSDYLPTHQNDVDLGATSTPNHTLMLVQRADTDPNTPEYHDGARSVSESTQCARSDDEGGDGVYVSGHLKQEGDAA